MGGGGGGGDADPPAEFPPDYEHAWRGPNDQCRIRIGTVDQGWHKGTVESLPAFSYKGFSLKMKDNLTDEQKTEAEKLMEKVKTFRFVQLKRYDNADEMNLGELEVYVGGQNVAAGKGGEESSRWDNDKGSDKLTDGNPRTMYHSRGGDGAWVQVDLGADYNFTDLGKIIVRNRRDCCQGRINNLYVELHNAKREKIYDTRDLPVKNHGDVILYGSDFDFPMATFESVPGEFNLRVVPLREKMEALTEKVYEGTKYFNHWRFHHGPLDRNVGRGHRRIGDNDIDILETQGTCDDVLWMYTDHGVYDPDGWIDDATEGTTFEKFKNGGDGTLVPINAGFNKLNSWDHYPAHGHFLNQISHMWARPIPKDKYNADMDIVGNIRAGHATVWRDGGAPQTNSMYEGDGRFFKQDERTTLKVQGGPHHEPKDQQGAINGVPCPGGKMHWINSQKVRCYYSNESEIAELQRTVANAQTGDPRIGMFEQIKNKFCNEAANIDKTIDGQKCRVWGDATKLTREYCGANNYEKLKAGDALCTREGMPEGLFETINNEFCEANAGDSWCKCYNLINGKCEANPEAAGCAEATTEYEEIIADLPEDSNGEFVRRELQGRMHCRAKVCASERDTFLPKERPDCKMDICLQNLNVGGHLTDADVDMNCSDDKGDTTPGGGYEDEDDDKGGLPAFFGGGKGKGKGSFPGVFLLAGGGGLLSLCCCCLLIILLLLMA